MQRCLEARTRRPDEPPLASHVCMSTAIIWCCPCPQCKKKECPVLKHHEIVVYSNLFYYHTLEQLLWCNIIVMHVLHSFLTYDPESTDGRVMLTN